MRRRAVITELTKSNIIAVYSMGFTCKEVGIILEVSAGEVYKVLKEAGVNFCNRNRHSASEETKEKIRKRKKGTKLTDAQKEAISNANSCNYNGLNGYGHTKNHNRGYVLAYAPKHPNCH